MRYSCWMKSFWANFSILLTHGQTIAIIGEMHLDWPASVKTTTNALSTATFLDAAALTPGCLFDINANFAKFTNMYSALFIAVVLCTTLVAGRCLRSRPHLADKIYFFN